MQDRNPLKRVPTDGLDEVDLAEFTEQNGWHIPMRFTNAEHELGASRQSAALADLSDWGKITVEGTDAAQILGAPELRVHQGKAAVHGFVYRLRPDVIFVSTAPDRVAEVLGALNSKSRASGKLITVTDITHGHSQFLLVGPHSPVLLSRLCGLDFSNGRFPNQSAKQSGVAKTKQLIIRNDIGSLRAYTIIGRQSLGRYLWKTILQAGPDLGISPIGRSTIAQLSSEG